MDVLLPNATLTKIAGGGTSEGYRDEEGPDAAKWTGESPVHVSDRTGLQRGLDDNRLTRNRQDVVRVTEMVVAGHLPEPAVGDTVEYLLGSEPNAREVWDIAPCSVLGTVTHRVLTLAPA